MKILRYYDDIFQAHTDREYLVSEGIPAEVLNENTGTVLPTTYANPSMRPYIAVPDVYYDRAATLVTVPPPSQVVCPECGGAEITCRLPRKHRWFTRLVAIPIILLGNAGDNIRKVYSCNLCGREFRI